MLKVVMQLNMKRKRPRGKTTWLDKHRSPPERKEHISERSPPNEMFREQTRLEDIDFSIN